MENILKKKKVQIFFSNKTVIAFLVAMLMFVFGEIIFPGFMSFSHVMSVLRLSVFLGIVALGQTLVIISGKEGIDLSVGSVVSIGVVISSYFLRGENKNIPLTLVIVLAAGFIIGLISGASISYLNVAPLIMTLAMASVVGGLTLIVTRGFPIGNAPPLLESLGSGKIFNIPYIIIFWIILTVIIVLILRNTKWGTILYGIGANNLAAELSGINTKRFRMWVYAIAGSISCFAGFLLLSYTGTPYLNLGAPYVMPSVAAATIGGVSLAGGEGNYFGTVAGCLVLTTLTSILVALQAGESIRQIVYGGVILILIIAYARPSREL
jgi:ribose transport system permease protein